MMGDNLKMINIPIEKVYTSPSCRARQTADLVFEGYDENLKKELLKINIPDNKNVIINGHNSVINEKIA